MSCIEKLKTTLREMESVVIGYSGGVDSTFLARAATDVLGKKAVCMLIDSCLIPSDEVREAIKLAREFNFNLINIKVDALAIANVPDNKPDRCYHCKLAVFSKINEIARERGIRYTLDGANLDDSNDYRPGTMAARELGVQSPLKTLGFTKQMIREASRELGLPTWDKPSSACLASRIPYGTQLTTDILRQVETAESSLKKMGFRRFRVRHHGDVARIELARDEMHRMLTAEMRDCITREFEAAGYKYVSLDLAGYKTGSMNKVLNPIRFT